MSLYFTRAIGEGLFETRDEMFDGGAGNYHPARDENNNVVQADAKIHIDARKGMKDATFLVDGEEVDTELCLYNGSPAHRIQVGDFMWTFAPTRDKSRWTGWPSGLGESTPMAGYDEFLAACKAAKKTKQNENRAVVDDGKGNSTVDLDSEDFEDDIPF
jgi:hypothetical protein